MSQVETVGNVYMIACGCPVPASDHASRLATLALNIRDYAEGLTARGHPLKLKMGINSGSVSFCSNKWALLLHKSCMMYCWHSLPFIQP